MLNPDIFSSDVTRSSPVLYHEYCIQDGNLVPKFSLTLLTLTLPVFTTHALLPMFPGGWKGKFDLKKDKCGRGNFWIWKEIVADSKISGYVWRGPEWTLEWLAIQWAFGIQAYGQTPQRAYSSQVHRSIQSVQMILTLKRGQKGWRQLFSETLQRTVFTNNEGSFLCFMCFILPHLVLLKLSREWAF